MSEQPGPSEPPTPEGPTEPASAPRHTDRKDPLRGSRTSGLWVGVLVGAIVMVLLIVFIAQNTQDVHVSFLGWDGETSLAVTVLIATAAGIILTAVAGTLRIWQLRRRVKRDRV